MIRASNEKLRVPDRRHRRIAADATRMYREIAESATAIARQLDANRDARARARRRAAPRSAALRRDRRARQLRQRGDVREISVRDAARRRRRRRPRRRCSRSTRPSRISPARCSSRSRNRARAPICVRQAEAAKRAGARVVAMVNVERFAARGRRRFRDSAARRTRAQRRGDQEFSLLAVGDRCSSPRNGRTTPRCATRSPRAGCARRRRRGWTGRRSSMASPMRRSLFVVGRGLGLAAAQEAALKLKETCGIHAEAFSAAEVQHGPMALVGAGFPVVFFVQDDDTRDSTLDVAEKFRARGAHVWTIGAEATAAMRCRCRATRDPACAPLRRGASLLSRGECARGAPRPRSGCAAASAARSPRRV